MNNFKVNLLDIYIFFNIFFNIYLLLIIENLKI